MIIVKIFGGLGNQMFQYAFGRRLALERNVPLKLDIASDYQNTTVRRYALAPFNIVESFATPEEVHHFVNSGFVNRSYRWLQRHFLPYSRRSWLKEADVSYQPEAVTAPARIYVEGYWQSEKYFAPIAPVIRRDFSFKAPPDAQNAAVAQQIERVEAVSLHVRRGDYASNTVINQVHGLLSLDYYRKAVERVAQRLHQPQFFIFSDDPQWVSAELQLPYPVTYISHNGDAHAYEDLRLMGLCQHHIIANSSFSWWGAWLSSNPNKIVICPAKWANLPSLNTRDRIPEGWEQVA